MKLRVIADTISTYLTLLSALILPVLMVAWVRSYMVSDSYLRVSEGRALRASVSNGEFSLWTAPAPQDVTMSDRRTRETSWGWSHRRTFQRNAGRDHIWFIGFAYAEPERIPWRTPVMTTGRGMAVCLPLWFVALLVAALPVRLIARNMQSSEEFLKQRAAQAEREQLKAIAASPSAPV